MTIRNLDALFKPKRVLWLGQPQNPGQAAILDKLRAQIGGILLQECADCLDDAVPALTDDTLTILSETRFANAETLARLGAGGVRGLIWPLHEPPSAAVLEAAREHTLRILGPRSVGLAHASGFDASTLGQRPLAGSMALIVQSQSVAAAAADWAAGRRIGFSWIAVTGGESDVDVADLLDYAALDPNTRSVAVEVGRIRGARKFMSAARACARAKPTVILQTRLIDREAAGADPVRSAAFSRAGLVEVPSLPGLFDALAAMQRLPEMTEPRVLIIANGAALCALSIDAALRQGLRIAELSESHRRALQARISTARFRPGAIDVGDPPAQDVVALLHLALQLPGVDALMFVRSPVAGHPHAPIAAALAQSSLGPRLLTVWLGLESALAARQLSTDAGQPTFTSPDAAARAIRYRWEYSRNRELLTQTPPRMVPPRLDARLVAANLQDHLGAGTDTLPDVALELLRAYGVESRSRIHREAVELEVWLERHPELGMHITLRIRGFGHAPMTHGFVPLDALLAARLLTTAGLDAVSEITARDLAAANTALVRIAQIPMDQAAVERLQLRMAISSGHARAARDARLWLTPGPAPERERLALAPYPAALTQSLHRPGEVEQTLRPVRPEDEPAVVALLQSLDTEVVRLRFFAHIRHFSHAMAARMTQIDYDRELALVLHARDEPERLRAIGTVILDPDGREAEFALLVHQDFARLGLGRHMLEALVAHARRSGVALVWGQVLAENTAMLGLAQSLGFTRRIDPQEPSCRRVELRLGAST